MDFVADQPALEFCTAGASEPASDGRTVLHALRGIVLHLHGEQWAPVYLPALAPYFVHDLTPRAGPHGYPAGAVVHLPEGLRGRRAKMVQRVDCARSPSAVVTCEGEPLGRDLRHDERDDVRGHVWRYSITHGITCVRCGCAGGVRPLTAEFAPRIVEVNPWRQPLIGEITCAIGDAETRNKLRAGTLDYLTGGFGKQLYMTSPQSRRAILQRATSPFDVGGRWELPEDVTPETASDEERPHWRDLGAMLLDSAAHLGADADALAVWSAWLAGDEPEAPPRQQWDPVYADLLTRQLAALVQQPGVVYLDVRLVLTALLRTGVAMHMRLAHPAEEVIRDLRSYHELIRARDERASVMVLFPQLDEKLERDSGLLVARKVWASGR